MLKESYKNGTSVSNLSKCCCQDEHYKVVLFQVQTMALLVDMLNGKIQQRNKEGR
jgi:hypothetical protein